MPHQGLVRGKLHTTIIYIYIYKRLERERERERERNARLTKRTFTK
jgi:hypothetical protein